MKKTGLPEIKKTLFLRIILTRMTEHSQYFGYNKLKFGIISKAGLPESLPNYTKK